MIALVPTAWLFLSLAAVAFATPPKCHVCDKPIPGKFFLVDDKARGGQFEVCSDCMKLETRCFACSLPVKSEFSKLPDGRFLCPACTRDAISSEEEAKKICLQTRDDLDRQFSRYFSFPQSNVVVTLVDQFTLESLFKSPGYARECTVIFGATQTHTTSSGARIHAINLLSSLNKAQLEAVAAHEFTHAWMNENLPTGRKAALSPDALEAFCELIAYRFMEDRGADFQKKVIQQNPYTHGQLEAFLAAESRHSFNAILNWMKSGEAARLDAADPDEVRATRAPESSTESAALPSYFRNASPPTLPDKLTLRSITGAPTRRLAIINDQTFGAKDRARVRLAGTNVTIRCLEIRTDSVLIRFEDSGAKQELFLPAN